MASTALSLVLSPRLRHLLAAAWLAAFGALAHAGYVDARLSFVVTGVQVRQSALLGTPYLINPGASFFGGMRVDDAVFARNETNYGAPGQVKDLYIRMGDTIFDQNVQAPQGPSLRPIVDLNAFDKMRSACSVIPLGGQCTPEELNLFHGQFSDIWGFDFSAGRDRVQGLYGGVSAIGDRPALDIVGNRFGAEVFVVAPYDLVACPGPECGLGYLNFYSLFLTGDLAITIASPASGTLLLIGLFGVVARSARTRWRAQGTPSRSAAALSG